MSVFELPPPSFDGGQLRELVERLFDIRGSIDTLPSERDQNALVAAEGDRRFTLKIANQGESRDLLQLENAAL